MPYDEEAIALGSRSGCGDYRWCYAYQLLTHPELAGTRTEPLASVYEVCAHW